MASSLASKVRFSMAIENEICRPDLPIIGQVFQAVSIMERQEKHVWIETQIAIGN